jgi:hypothetical protein
MLEDLSDPAERRKASLSRTGKPRGTVVSGFNERAHPIAGGSGTLLFPFRGFFPKCNLAGFRLPRIMSRDTRNPRPVEGTSLFILQFILAITHVLKHLEKFMNS